MFRLEGTKRILQRWFSSVAFFALLGLALGVFISIAAIPEPDIATISISGAILNQSYTDNILDALKQAGDDNHIKAVVLQIDSPGSSVSAAEQIYLDLVRLRQKKPIVVSIGPIAASGGYYIAVASNFIYAEPTSYVGSIGVWARLPEPEELDDNVEISGPFKASGGSRQKFASDLEMVRQEFVEAVTLQRGDRLKLSEEELSQAAIYNGVEGARHGLIDDIGTRTNAMEKAAVLAGLRNYGTVDLTPAPSFSFLFFGSSDLAALKSRNSLVPEYYFLYFEPK